MARCAAAAAVLVGLSVPVLFWRLGTVEVEGILEARVAITAREMLRRNEWILPTMNGELRLQKPPLAYWLPMLLAAGRGTFDEWTLRLPFAFVGVATLFVVWRIGSIYGGSRHGLLAGIVLLSSPLFMKEFRIAATDPALCFAVAGAWWCHAEGMARMRWNDPTNARGRLPQLGFWLFAALGTVAKGPVALAWTLLPILFEAAVTRSRAPLRAIWNPWGLSLCLILSLLWPAMVTVEVGVEVVWKWFLESFGKVLPSDGIEDGYRYQRHSGSWHYYLARLPSYFGFWTVALPIALWRHAPRLWGRSTCPQRDSDRTDSAPFFQIVLMLAFFSFVEEKKAAYVLPLLVPGSILVAGELAAVGPSLLMWLKRCAGVAAVGAAGVLALFCSAHFASFPTWMSADATVGPWVGIIGVAMAGLVAVALIPVTADPRLPFLAIGTALAIGTLPYWELRRLRAPDELPMKTEALATRPLLESGKPLFAAGILPRDFLFYLDADVRFIHREVEGDSRLDAEKLAHLQSGDKLLISFALATRENAAPQKGAQNGAAIEQIQFAAPLYGFRLLKAIHPSARRQRDRVVLVVKE